MQTNLLTAGMTALLFSTMVIACTSKASDKKNNAETASAPAGLPVDVRVVSDAPVSQTEVVAGSVVANRSVDVTGELPKKIVAVHFRDGSAVSQGQVLYTLDDTDLRARIRQLDADLDLAAINEQRLDGLLKTETVRKEEYEAAAARLHSLRAAKDILLAELSKTVIRAPFSGFAGISRVFTGSYVTPGIPLVTLQEQHVVKIQFSVSEKYLRYIKPGTKVHFRTEMNSEEVPATIVTAEAAVDVMSRSVLVQAITPNPNGALKPGMSAKVYFRTSAADAKGIMIPTEALIPGNDGYNVFLVKAGHAKMHPVKIGNRNASEAMIISGLAPGDTVMVSNILRASDGVPVQIVSSTN